MAAGGETINHFMSQLDDAVYSGDAKICFWDLECSSLFADFGFAICVGYKFLGDKDVKIIRVDQFRGFRTDPTNDKKLVAALAKVLSKADILVTHYGSSGRFDRRFLNTRLLYHGLSPLPPIKEVDTWHIAKTKLALTSNRLGAIVELLDLPEKTPIKRPVWIRAMSGHRPSINYIATHCARDIEVLEAAYLKLRSLAGKHANVSLFSCGKDGKARCPVCGSLKVQKKGYNIASSRVTQRYQCQSCGAWGHGRAEKVGKEIKMRKCV